MKISVVIAAYHGEKYIRKQLESLFTQTLVPHEILVGDDSGDEKTASVVQSLRPQFGGELRLIRNPVRLGIIGNFKNLVQQASGDLIFFCDQDDIWLPDKIRIMSEALESAPDKLLAVCRSKRVDSHLKDLCAYPVYADPVQLSRTAVDLDRGAWEGFIPLFLLKIIFYGHNMVMKKELRHLFPTIPENFPGVYHDIFLGWIASAAGKMLYVDQALTLYRVHAENVSASEEERRQSFRERLQSLRIDASSDLERSAAQLQYLIDLYSRQENRPLIPAAHLDKLKTMEDFFMQRWYLRRRGFLRRVFFAGKNIFRYGKYQLSFKSVLRDLFL